MDDILGLSPRKTTGDAQRIKALVRQRFGLDDDVAVMVSEVRCHEDGCPDVETVVAVLKAVAPRQSWKIPKQMPDIGVADIEALSAP